MSRPPLSYSYLRLCVAACILLGAYLAFPAMVGGVRTASASALYSVPEVSVTIPAGGSAQLQVRGIALQPGSAIASAAVALSSQPAPASNVRMALYYGINWGYADSEPQQAALAVWYVQDGVWRDSSHATADKIASAASSTTNTPSWTPAGKSVVQLAGQGQVTLSGITFAPLAQSPANGSGALTVSNSSAQDVTVYLPYGTVFGSGPSATLVWAVAAAAKSDPQPSATTAPPTTEPSATATSAATSESAPQKGAPSPTPTTEESAPPPPPTQTSLPSKAPPVVPTATSTNTDTPLPSDTPTSTPVPPSATPMNTPLPPSATATVQQAAQPAPEKSQPTAANSDAGSTSGTSANSGSANSASKPGTQAGTSANAQNAQGANSANNAGSVGSAENANASKQSTASGNAESSGQASTGSKANSQTDAIAPVIPTPITPSPTARRSGSAPPPVGTAQSSTQAAPSAVGTAEATVGARATNTPAPSTSNAAPTVTPVLRSGGTSTPTTAPGQAKPPAPVPSSQAGISPSPTSRVPAPAPSQQATVSTGQAATATRQVAPVEPTKLTDVAPSTPPVIDAGTDGGGSDGQGSGASASGSVQGTVTTPPVGPKPDSTPTTGAGPSPLPLVLSLSSMVLVLIGWQLRRLARAQAKSGA